MIPEREREALMRLTMCARGECPMCKYEKQCDNWDFRMELATKNMNILADALRKTENSSEKPNNCKPQTNRIADKKPTPIRDFMVNGKVKDEPQTDCPFGEDDKCFGCGDNTKCVVFDEPQTERSE